MPDEASRRTGPRPSLPGCGKARTSGKKEPAVGLEIERKFLVAGDGWRALGMPERYRQGYLCRGTAVVRVRIAGERGRLSVKGKNIGPVRREFEYEIPVAEAEEMLAELCDGPIIDKCRTTLVWEGSRWEVDEFFGDNQGLILAEIELSHPDEAFARPPWLGAEVTDDPRYYNSNLALRPYRTFRG